MRNSKKIASKYETAQGKLLKIMIAFASKSPYSWNSVYRDFRKWYKCEVFQNVLMDYLPQIKGKNLPETYLDGTYTKARCRGEQGRKKAKTTNLLYLTDASGRVLSISLPIARNHNDLKDNYQALQTDVCSTQKSWIAP